MALVTCSLVPERLRVELGGKTRTPRHMFDKINMRQNDDYVSIMSWLTAGLNRPIQSVFRISLSLFTYKKMRHHESYEVMEETGLVWSCSVC